ncbi:hypothetical protein TRICI_006173 [Trichomonascus ciferrii]|uniref:Uncharacterized protein n=1 Tax=Trichomonascus ciferrii TaxID=44093 RepID=A0A642UK76_9ASCO|nr:hypothetical protein TRICI_006173 [Trichomonascus ciferrii]
MTTEELQPLNFKGSLVQTRNSDELFSLLETLSVELGHLEQEQTDLATLRTVSQELISSRLMKNKNAGIRTLTACCLMEVLRIHAPDAPYSIEMLKVSASSTNPPLTQPHMHDIYDILLFQKRSKSTSSDSCLDTSSAKQFLKKTSGCLLFQKRSKSVSFCFAEDLVNVSTQHPRSGHRGLGSSSGRQPTSSFPGKKQKR